ncbi:MAG: hypothetical protein WCA46_01400, partial [Actinocatenispora sp.]
MAVPPPLVRCAAREFGIPVESLRPLPGATGLTWRAGEHILRLGARAVLDVEAAAMAAAGTVLPVPAIMDRVDLPAGDPPTGADSAG